MNMNKEKGWLRKAIAKTLTKQIKAVERINSYFKQHGNSYYRVYSFELDALVKIFNN